MTDYEQIERKQARNRLRALKHAIRRYSDQLILHGPAVAECESILNELTFKDVIDLAAFAEVNLSIKLERPTPLEKFTRGAFADDA